MYYTTMYYYRYYYVLLDRQCPLRSVVVVVYFTALGMRRPEATSD